MQLLRSTHFMCQNRTVQLFSFEANTLEASYRIRMCPKCSCVNSPQSNLITFSPWVCTSSDCTLPAFFCVWLIRFALWGSHSMCKNVAKCVLRFSRIYSYLFLILVFRYCISAVLGRLSKKAPRPVIISSICVCLHKRKAMETCRCSDCLTTGAGANHKHSSLEMHSFHQRVSQ